MNARAEARALIAEPAIELPEIPDAKLLEGLLHLFQKPAQLRRALQGAAAQAPASTPIVLKVMVKPERYVTIKLAAAVTGYTESAIRHKIDEGVWLENREWIRGPDRIMIDLEGYRRWVEKGRA